MAENLVVPSLAFPFWGLAEWEDSPKWRFSSLRGTGQPVLSCSIWTSSATMWQGIPIDSHLSQLSARQPFAVRPTGHLYLPFHLTLGSSDRLLDKHHPFRTVSGINLGGDPYFITCFMSLSKAV